MNKQFGSIYVERPTSPAIDAGDPATVNEVGFDGHIPHRADIGAFETELFIKLPNDIFQESGGVVVMEAEHYTRQLLAPNSQAVEASRRWQPQAGLADYAGAGYLSALPDMDLQYTATGPELDYTVSFTSTGTYYIWLRGYAPNAAGDSVYVALDNQPTEVLTGFAPRAWSWANKSDQGLPVTVEITQPGFHTLRIRPREDGMRLDRILLTLDSGYNPDGAGPSESEFR